MTPLSGEVIAPLGVVPPQDDTRTDATLSGSVADRQCYLLKLIGFFLFGRRYKMTAYPGRYTVLQLSLHLLITVHTTAFASTRKPASLVLKHASFPDTQPSSTRR